MNSTYLHIPLVMILAILPGKILGQTLTPEDDPLEIASQALEEHYKLQRVIAKERRDWEIVKAMKTAEIDLLTQQINELELKKSEQTGEMKEKATAFDKLREELAELEDVTKVQYDQIEDLEKRLRQAIPLLPKYLSQGDQFSQLLERLPEPGKKREDVKASISDRYVAVMGILKLINKFNAAPTIVEEPRQIGPDGPEVMTTTMYLGLAQAYFVGQGVNSGQAGVGVPGEDGWTWIPMNEKAKEIDRVIRLGQGEGEAAYIPIPIQIK